MTSFQILALMAVNRFGLPRESRNLSCVFMNIIMPDRGDFCRSSQHVIRFSVLTGGVMKVNGPIGASHGSGAAELSTSSGQCVSKGPYTLET